MTKLRQYINLKHVNGLKCLNDELITYPMHLKNFLEYLVISKKNKDFVFILLSLEECVFMFEQRLTYDLESIFFKQFIFLNHMSESLLQRAG